MQSVRFLLLSSGLPLSGFCPSICFFPVLRPLFPAPTNFTPFSTFYRVHSDGALEANCAFC